MESLKLKCKGNQILIVEEVWKKIIFSFHNVFCGRQKPIREMATEKNQQQKQNKNRTRHLLRLLFLIYINSNCIATRVNVDNCTFKATVHPYNQFWCSNCTYFHKKNVNIIWKINIFYSLLCQGQLLILFFPLIDHESIWTYSICSASECRYFLFKLVLRRVKGRWFIVL